MIFRLGCAFLSSIDCHAAVWLQIIPGGPLHCGAGIAADTQARIPDDAVRRDQNRLADCIIFSIRTGSEPTNAGIFFENVIGTIQGAKRTGLR